MAHATATNPAPATPVSWRSIYPVHPCADVFPMMPDAELGALAEDIRQHGLQQPVVLWEAPRVPRTPAAYFVLDGRNRLEALVRLGVEIPKPNDPREMRDLPGRRFGCVFEIANDRSHWQAPQVQDPAEYVIGANIRRRHLTKEQQAELIVKTIEAGKNDGAKVARSFSPTPGIKGGSTKDPGLARAISEGKKHGISPRTMKRARAKVQGKTPTTKPKVGVSSRPPARAVDPVRAPKPKLDVVTFKRELFPILKGLKAEGRKNMATMSPGTVAHLTFQLEQLLDRLDASATH